MLSDSRKYTTSSSNGKKQNSRGISANGGDVDHAVPELDEGTPGIGRKEAKATDPSAPGLRNRSFLSHNSSGVYQNHAWARIWVDTMRHRQTDLLMGMSMSAM